MSSPQGLTQHVSILPSASTALVENDDAEEVEPEPKRARRELAATAPSSLLAPINFAAPLPPRIGSDAVAAAGSPTSEFHSVEFVLKETRGLMASNQRRINQAEATCESFKNDILELKQFNANINATIAVLSDPSAQRPIKYRDVVDVGPVILSLEADIKKNMERIDFKDADIRRHWARIDQLDADNRVLNHEVTKLTTRRDSLRARSSGASISSSLNVITPLFQKKASQFVTAEPAQVFGHLPLSTRFDPTHDLILSALIPTQGELDATTCNIYCAELLNFRTLGEVKANPNSVSVTQQFNRVLSAFQTDDYSAEINSLTFQEIMVQGNTLWPSFGCPFSAESSRNVGICTRDSIPDFTIYGKVQGNKLIVGLGELKGMDIGIDAAVIQAAVGGSHLATNLLSLGFEAGSFCVPVVSSNGLLMQFGAVVVLSNSTFPVYVPISDSFDLRSRGGNQRATAYFQKTCQYAHHLAERMMMQHLNQLQVINSMQFSTEHYYVKKMNLQGALKHFDPHNLQCGLNHMIRCYNAMYKFVELRSHIAFPVAVYTESEKASAIASANASSTAVSIAIAKMIQSSIQLAVASTADRHKAAASAASASDAVIVAQGFADVAMKAVENAVTQIIANPKQMNVVFKHYGHVVNGSYRTGCPDRIANHQLFEQYRLELFRVVGLMHSSGVIHGDLYLSNVMWRENDRSSGVDIILIDFDSAHLLEEGEFTLGIRNNIATYFQTNGIAMVVKLEAAHDLKYLDVLNLEVTAKNTELWHKLASNNVRMINEAFQKLLQLKYSDSRQ